MENPCSQNIRSKQSLSLLQHNPPKTKKKRSHSERVPHPIQLSSIIPLPNGPKQIKKQIDKIQIQLQRRKDGRFLGHLPVIAVRLMVSLDLLGIIGRKQQENKDPHATGHHLKPLQVNEHGHNPEHQKEHQSAHQEIPQTAKIHMGLTGYG